MKAGSVLRKIRAKITSPFAKFISNKVLFLSVAIFITMNAVFFLPRLMPSGPVEIMLGRIASGGSTSLGLKGPEIAGPQGLTKTIAMREIYIEKFGLGKPVEAQYFEFWRRFFTFDFGKSFGFYPTKISTLIAGALPWTLALIIPVLPVGFIVGNWIGSRAAYYRGKMDNFLYYVSMFLSRAPYYWFALIFMLIFAVKLGWFPLGSAYSATWTHPVFDLNWFLDALSHYILPFASIIGLGIGGWAVGMRAMTIYEMESDYMVYSKQLGFSESRLREYAEENAILPNFTHLNNVFAGLIGQTLLVEVVFGYPGLGMIFYGAIFNHDYPLIEASFMITVIIVLVGNYLVIDVIYGIIDPRIGSAYVEEE